MAAARSCYLYRNWWFSRKKDGWSDTKRGIPRCDITAAWEGKTGCALIATLISANCTGNITCVVSEPDYRKRLYTWYQIYGDWALGAITGKAIPVVLHPDLVIRSVSVAAVISEL